MLRKSVTMIAIAAGLIGFTGEAFAQQAPTKPAATSTIKRVGAVSGRGVNGAAAGTGLPWYFGTPAFTNLVVFGAFVGLGYTAARNNNNSQISGS